MCLVMSVVLGGVRRREGKRERRKKEEVGRLKGKEKLENSGMLEGDGE